MLDGGDPTATELFKKFKGVRMPDPNLSEQDTDGLLSYIKDCTQAGGCKIALGTVKHANEATAADVEAGRKLFSGVAALENGGPACASCHQTRDLPWMGGGTLAKDLTLAYGRLGDGGISSALLNTAFPLMADIFPNRPLKDGEAFQIKAYLASLSKKGVEAVNDYDFLYLGILGTSGGLALIGVHGTRRLKSVRAQIVQKAKA